MFDNETGLLKKKQYFLILLGFAVAATFFTGGLYLGSQSNGHSLGAAIFANDSSLPPVGVDLRPVWKAWHTLEERFVPVSTSTNIQHENLVWGLIQGLADAYDDPYTVFLPPADAEIFEDDISGNFEGVGMEIGMRSGVLTVIAPLKGTPAEKAGILSGDAILRIDDRTTDGLSIDEAVKIIRGPGGTPVVFTIAREDESELLEISVTRAVIEIPTIDTTIRSDGIFVIELYNFSALSSILFREALREFTVSGSDKLILDMRGNPGGFLEAAVDIASWFLPAGTVVLREEFGGKQEERAHRSKGYDIFDENLGMVILINEGSASASEILAGALQEHGIATLVGEQSFGKGSVQELVRITPDTSLKVTIARWLTPKGRSISDGGLTPDVVVERTAEDFEAMRDPQLDRAVSILLQNR